MSNSPAKKSTNKVASQALLACSDLNKSYQVQGKEIPVLRGISMQIAPGEIVAVTGASGSGKSTLLYLLGLLDKPTSGSISWQGEDLLSKTTKWKRKLLAEHIGFVFQHYHLVPECNVLENVLLAERARTRSGNVTPEGETRARELIAKVGLEHRIDHLPSELSGGEQQRVALSRALMNRPELLLADEPTGNLDESTGNHVYDLLVDLVKEDQSSMLIVTHNPAIANRCDRVLRLENGVVKT